MGGLPTTGWGRVASPSRGVQVSQGLVHEWGENGAEYWQKQIKCDLIWFDLINT